MVNFSRAALAGVFAAILLTACSTVSKILPGTPEPVCGSAIDRGAVLVLDMTGYRMQEDRIAAAVEARVGSYRIMTDEPVWIPKRSADRVRQQSSSIVSVQSIAADWGCNLLVLLDTKMAQTGVMVQARNEERVWLVHAGRREMPR